MAKDMSDKDARRLLKRARLSAKLCGAEGLVTDIAQTVLLKFVEGKNPNQTVQYAAIDALRKELGRTGDYEEELRAALLRAEPLDRVPELKAEKKDRRGFASLIGSLKGSERAIIKLLYEWGLTLLEVADLFGLAESEICLKKRHICIKLKRELEK